MRMRHKVYYGIMCHTIRRRIYPEVRRNGWKDGQEFVKWMCALMLAPNLNNYDQWRKRRAKKARNARNRANQPPVGATDDLQPDQSGIRCPVPLE